MRNTYVTMTTKLAVFDTGTSSFLFFFLFLVVRIFRRLRVTIGTTTALGCWLVGSSGSSTSSSLGLDGNLNTGGVFKMHGKSVVSVGRSWRLAHDGIWLCCEISRSSAEPTARCLALG